jgi:hypothetical protein
MINNRLFNLEFADTLNNEEKERRNKAENIVFKWNVGLKYLGAFLLLNIRLYKRPVGRSWIYDFLLLYSGVYSILLSNVIGVHKAWPLYEDLAYKMVSS